MKEQPHVAAAALTGRPALVEEDAHHHHKLTLPMVLASIHAPLQHAGPYCCLPRFLLRRCERQPRKAFLFCPPDKPTHPSTHARDPGTLSTPSWRTKCRLSCACGGPVQCTTGPRFASSPQQEISYFQRGGEHTRNNNRHTTHHKPTHPKATPTTTATPQHTTTKWRTTPPPTLRRRRRCGKNKRSWPAWKKNWGASPRATRLLWGGLPPPTSPAPATTASSSPA